jgi:hypothetical protein
MCSRHIAHAGCGCRLTNPASYWGIDGQRHFYDEPEPRVADVEKEILHPLDNGEFVISDAGGWLPGCYDTAVTARAAFRLPIERLEQLQQMANDRAGGTGGVLTLEDLTP